eukprot:TRINITY_DN95067_c0_g1_i1.p1 TRINITY_DN95067_c0_g1~~TRINITY_DN95067_c0_g1_i1.p1  ORF type:complete len:318 (+),score=96.52 TRINITY_DN95067_c0_g1_i1:72-1025(+)
MARPDGDFGGSAEEDIVGALPLMKDVYNRLRDARGTVNALETSMNKAIRSAASRIVQLQDELEDLKATAAEAERIRRKLEREAADAKSDAAGLRKRLADARTAQEAELEAENKRRQRATQQQDDEVSGLRSTIAELRSQLKDPASSQDKRRSPPPPEVSQQAAAEAAPQSEPARQEEKPLLRRRRREKREGSREGSVMTDLEAEDRSPAPAAGRGSERAAATARSRSRSGGGEPRSSTTRQQRRDAPPSPRQGDKGGKAGGKGKGKPNICMPHVLGKCSKGDGCPSMHLGKEDAEKFRDWMARKRKDDEKKKAASGR